MSHYGPKPIDPRVRFESFVERVTESGCALWAGAVIGRYGYGIFRAACRMQVYAHRFAWEMANGPIPAGMLVCHRCDVYRCVNPSHLYLGTQADNLRDMRSKGRQARGATHGNARLTVESVEIIRASTDTDATLAARFGVTRCTVSLARRRKTWSHV
jgi:hypothetical protein